MKTSRSGRPIKRWDLLATLVVPVIRPICICSLSCLGSPAEWLPLDRDQGALRQIGKPLLYAGTA
jgi:hypothetical protein